MMTGNRWASLAVGAHWRSSEIVSQVAGKRGVGRLSRERSLCNSTGACKRLASLRAGSRGRSWSAVAIGRDGHRGSRRGQGVGQRPSCLAKGSQMIKRSLTRSRHPAA